MIIVSNNIEPIICQSSRIFSNKLFTLGQFYSYTEAAGIVQRSQVIPHHQPRSNVKYNNGY